MELHQLMSVTATAEPDVYIASVDLTDSHGERYVADYVSRDDDTFGLAPVVRSAVLQWIADGKPVGPYVPAPEPVPQEISRRQFYQGLAVAEFITKQEALDAIKGAALPAALQSIVDSLPDADDRFSAEMLLLGAGEFQRDHALVTVFVAAQDLTETEVDDFWRLCASLT